jgi:5-methylcytosine-specific restriction endonuclease McrA
MMKRCCNCKEEKPLDEFYRARTRKDGRATVCKQCSKELSAEWIALHPEKVAIYSRQKYERHTEAHQASTRRWVKKHPERVKELHRISESSRRARKRDQFVEKIDPMIVYSRDEGLCGICDTTVYGEFHIDHVVPLSKGGEHSYANVQLAHPSCNLSKGANIMNAMITKYQSVEHAEVLSPDEQARIEKGLRRLGKSSLQEATEAERKQVLDPPSE